jgi:hypothetical protein
MEVFKGWHLHKIRVNPIKGAGSTVAQVYACVPEKIELCSKVVDEQLMEAAYS